MVLQEFVKYPSAEVYIILALVLAAMEWGIMTLSRRFLCGPCVTDRSLHRKFTPTGGGMVWVVAGIVAVCFFGDLHCITTWMFMGGIAVLGIVSYVDDLHPLPPVPRLIVQTIVMLLTFKQLWYPAAIDVLIIVLFCGVGIINAVNFLDGICGMLALYGIVVTGSLFYAFYVYDVSAYTWLFMVLSMVLVAQVVFACFNLCDVIFSGDVGSITLGYIQVFAAIVFALNTHDASVMIFFSVCVFDVGLTTMHRLFLGESILKPHRSNIYQMLTTEAKMPHVVVALIYSLLQLLINALYFLIPETQHWTYFLITCALLSVAYFAIRFSLKLEKKQETV